MYVLEVAGLRKAYGAVRAVDGVDLAVEGGEVFALLGPNGAGKTTTVEILEGYRRADAGTVRVLGIDPQVGGRRLRERIGIVLQSAGVYPELTVEEAVTLHAGYYPHPRRVGEVLELAGLREQRRARVKTLSGGQQRRVDLALGIIGDPDVVFLDEPTTGFDPSARRRAWEVVKGLCSFGRTVLLTTHYMDEAQHLADRVAVLAHGRIVAQGTPADLGGRDRGAVVVRFQAPAAMGVGDLPPALRPLAEARGPEVLLRTPDPTRVLHALTGWALERGMELEGLAVDRPSLEDVYLRLVGDQEPVDA
jgi:ABC-2 type transport system ATP-binding protein